MVQRRLLKHYQDVVSQDILLIQNLDNLQMLPSIKEIVVNSSSKMYMREGKLVIPALAALEMISSQKPSTTWARQSIAAFKLRKGALLGCKLTLRGERMYSFLERLILLVLPRVREFQPLLATSCDEKGNYTLGVEGLMGFSELEPYFEYFEHVGGIDITFVFNNSKIGSFTTSRGEAPQRGGERKLEKEWIKTLSKSNSKSRGADLLINSDTDRQNSRERPFVITPATNTAANYSAFLLSAFQLPFVGVAT